jgi:hypothetical protein
MARRFRPQDKALTMAIREGQGKIFAEDLQMLESQQRNLLERPERRLLMLNIDLGGVRSRKAVEAPPLDLWRIGTSQAKRQPRLPFLFVGARPGQRLRCANLLRNFSTRPPRLSTLFCVPV